MTLRIFFDFIKSVIFILLLIFIFLENSDGWHLLCINCRYIAKCRVNLAIKYLVQAIASSSHSSKGVLQKIFQKS